MIVAALALPCAAAAQQSAPSGQPVRTLAMPSLEELNATRNRPLFAPSRRPDAKVAAPADQSVVEEPPASVPFDLTGIVMGEDHAVAILQNRDTQEILHLKQGESADVWGIAEIGQRYVVLRNEGRQVRLQLFEPRPDGSEPIARTPIDYERPRPRRPVVGDQSMRRSERDRDRDRERERRRRQMLRQQQN